MRLASPPDISGEKRSQEQADSTFVFQAESLILIFVEGGACFVPVDGER